MKTNISRLNLFGDCEQRYDYAYEPREGFPYGMAGEDASVEEDPKSWGSAVHEGLKEFYGNNWNRQGAIEAYRKKLDEISGSAGGDEQHALAAFGERLLGHYFDRYAAADREWKILATEEDWAVDVGPHTFMGRWDLVVHAKMGGPRGTLWHVQHKTTGASSLDMYVRQYDLAWHERAYGLAIKQRWPDTPVGGTILNLIRRPRSGAKKVDPEQDFRRYHVSVGQDSIQRFVRDAAQRIERIEQRRKTQTWEQNPKSCLMYGKLCMFHGLCLGLPIMEDYQPREKDYVDEARELVTG